MGAELFSATTPARKRGYIAFATPFAKLLFDCFILIFGFGLPGIRHHHTSFKGFAFFSQSPHSQQHVCRPCVLQDLNKRDQGTTRAAYTKMVIEVGIVDGARSELMAIPGMSNGEQVHYFIAGATLAEAAYDAFESSGAPDCRQTMHLAFLTTSVRKIDVTSLVICSRSSGATYLTRNIEFTHRSRRF